MVHSNGDILSNTDTANDKVLNQIAMPILDDSVCQRHYPTVLNESEICVGMERGGKDWCDVSTFNNGA